jgi:hypothetical protein
MNWRPLPASPEIGPVPVYLESATGAHHDPRSAGLVEALARLEVATRLRDGDSAARILAGLAETADGQWLLRQCVAAGLREVADHIAGPAVDAGPVAGPGLGHQSANGPGRHVAEPGVRSIPRSWGPAA